MANLTIERGDIVYVDRHGAMGVEKTNSSTSNSRPCVVVQNNGGDNGSPLIGVAPLSDVGQNTGYAQQVQVTAAEVGAIGATAVASVVECGHIRTMDRDARILNNCGPIASAELPRLDAALTAGVGLTGGLTLLSRGHAPASRVMPSYQSFGGGGATPWTA